jgi:hypothetical protein
MKYLKKYKIFENNQDIDYICDILSDLKDNYFDIRVRSTKQVGDLYHRVIADYLKTHYLNINKVNASDIIEVNITRYPESPTFRYSEIESEISSVVNYMVSDGWSYILDPVFDGSSGIGYHIDDPIFLRNMNKIILTGFAIRFYSIKN